MKLNCKPGQLAVKIKQDAGDLIPVGAIVTCIEYCAGINARNAEPIISWKVEYRGNKKSPRGFTWHAFDEYLRPIRDSDGEDETLTWAGKPEKKEKEAVE